MSRSGILQDYPLLIPYQIDFHTSTTGKHISLTKRHVRWRFGFVHLQSLVSGETGVSCRGIELEIHLIWSIASGKYVIYINKIPFRQNTVPSRMTSKFEVSFCLPENALPGNHQIYLKSYATTVGISPQEPQFDMHFDGQRYSRFYRIFEIGGARMVGYYRATLDDMVGKGILNGFAGHANGSARHANAVSMVPTQRQTDSNEEKSNDIHSIVRGRNRYKAGTNNKGSHDYVPRSTLLRSPSDPGLFENHTFEEMDRNRQTVNRTSTAPTRNEWSNLGSSGISYSNNTPNQFATSQPQSTTENNRRSTNRNETKTLGSDKDLMNFTSEESVSGSGIRGLVRSTSSVTMDTLLKNAAGEGSRVENDDISVAMYSHLDPRNMYKTQQNLSFRLQNPPVYADTAAGDLIQPLYEGANGVAHTSPMTNQNSVGGLPPHHGHLPFSPPQNFQTPPPPTWDTFNTAFASPPAHQTYNAPQR